MSNYTMVDLRMDYKKDTGNHTLFDYRSSKEYVQYLEEELIKYRDFKKKQDEMFAFFKKIESGSGISDAIFKMQPLSPEIKLTEEQ